MSEKVVITRSQAQALNKFNWQGFTPSDVITLKFRKLEFQVDSESAYLIIKHMDLDTLTKALYIGYEVEQTPEDKIFNKYKIAKKISDESEDKFNCYHQGQVDAIEMVLRTLKIEIEGIHK